MDEIQINFKDYISYTLKRWKWIFIFGVVCAMIIGGLATYKTITSWSGRQDDYDKQVEEYNEDYADYDMTISAMTYGNALSEERLRHEEEYMSKSIKIGLNPYNLLVVKTDIMIINGAVASGTDALPTGSITEKQILKEYYNYLYEFADWEAVGGLLNTEGIYVKELVDASIDYDSMTVELIVMFPDEGYSLAITDMLVNDANEKMNKKYGVAPVIIAYKTDYTVDTDLDVFIQEKWENYEALIKKVNDGNINIEKYKEPEMPSNKNLSKKRAAVKLFIFAVIGFIIGVCIMFIFYYNKFAKKGIIYSAGEFERITGIKNIGVFEAKSKKNKGEKLLGSESVYKRIKICLDNIPDMNKIMIIGQNVAADNAIVSKLKSIIDNKQIVIYDDINDNKTLEALYDCDGVIFAFEREKTMLADALRAKKFADDNGKKIIGSIVL